ncbi:MAG: tetratricopeptide repeat protein [Amylibacter sp.]
MIELAKTLGEWPPRLFSNPMEYLLEELEPVMDFLAEVLDTPLDILTTTKDRLSEFSESWPDNLSVEEEIKGYFLGAEVTDEWLDELVTLPLAVVEKPEKSPLYFLLLRKGEFHFDNGGQDAVVELSRKASEIVTEGDEALDNWGLALSKQKKFDEAIKKFAQADAIEPNDYLTLNNWGSALCEQKNYDKGIEKHKEALAIKPDKHEALLNRGVVLSQQNKYDEAMEKYADVVAIKPDEYPALDN